MTTYGKRTGGGSSAGGGGEPVFTGGLAIHVVRVATTANHGLSGLAAIDGATPVDGDRVLARSQTAPAENGIYVAASGAWTRAADFDDATNVVPATLVLAREGTLFAASFWCLTTTGTIVVGTTALTFKRAFTLTGGNIANVGVPTRGDEDSGLFYDGAGILYMSVDGVNLLYNDASFNVMISRQLYFDAGLANGIGHGTHLRLKGTPDVQIGVDGAIATNATAGFLDLPSCAGVPSGVPTPGTAKVPSVEDSTNVKSWRCNVSTLDWYAVSRCGKGADVASAATTVIAAADRTAFDYFQLTGTTTIDFLGYYATDVYGAIKDGEQVTFYVVTGLTINNNTGGPPSNGHAFQNVGAIAAVLGAGSKICYRRDNALAKWVEMWRTLA